jgi:enamine deaminase RidA (YjgF/YER057c/UK114 family)
MLNSEPVSSLAEGAGCSSVDLGDSVRLAFMVTPRGSGRFSDQVREVLTVILTLLEKQPQPMVVTSQTIFLRDAGDQADCERAFAEFYGSKLPVTNFVLQPPCCGAALAVEVWAIGGKDVRVEHFGPQVLAVSYDSVRWVYCAGITPDSSVPGVYPQTLDALGRLRSALTDAGSSFRHVVRTWFYLGDITVPEGDGSQRYQELNRARADFYRDIHFNCASPIVNESDGVYPASTGIGMAGSGLVASCMALETNRADVLLLPLENPRQTPAYAYDSKHSPQSPKFSRAVALVLGDYVTTWVSGTASIVDSESCHLGDVEKQTEQTIENIERLIAVDNFEAHGLKGAGAGLRDLAKIRVYLKRPEDLGKCRVVCEQRFGPVPAIYATADVCRPELLVEIEGVAFSRLARS